MSARLARVVQSELRAERYLEMIADVGYPRSRENRGKGLPGWSRYELVVVEFVEQEHIPQRPFQSDVLNIVAEIRERVLDHGVGKHVMAGRSAERRYVAKI